MYQSSQVITSLQTEAQIEQEALKTYMVDYRHCLEQLVAIKIATQVKLPTALNENTI